LNFSTCWSIAALKNIARIIGAGPLIVIDTEVIRAAQVEAVRTAPSCRRAWRSNARIADLAVRCRAGDRDRIRTA